MKNFYEKEISKLKHDIEDCKVQSHLLNLEKMYYKNRLSEDIAINYLVCSIIPIFIAVLLYIVLILCCKLLDPVYWYLFLIVVAIITFIGGKYLKKSVEKSCGKASVFKQSKKYKDNYEFLELTKIETLFVNKKRDFLQSLICDLNKQYEQMNLSSDVLEISFKNKYDLTKDEILEKIKENEKIMEEEYVRLKGCMKRQEILSIFDISSKNILIENIIFSMVIGFLFLMYLSIPILPHNLNSVINTIDLNPNVLLIVFIGIFLIVSIITFIILISSKRNKYKVFLKLNEELGEYKYDVEETKTRNGYMVEVSSNEQELEKTLNKLSSTYFKIIDLKLLLEN